jgi:hypothetical protein
MNIILPDNNKIITQNKLPEVTNPVYIEGSNTPTPDGIFSYELFGRPGSAKRKFQFGYINLGKHFLHPVAYMQLQRLFSKLPDIISGRKKFVIGINGILQESEDGETGIDFLYKNFEKINFDDRGIKIRKKRSNLFLSYNKNEIFCDKWLSIPPFYYDLNLYSGDSARSIDELGSFYIKLLSYSKMLRNEGSFFSAYNAEMLIQHTLVDIYNFLFKKIGKKRGLIHNDLLGKNIDYTSRGVISCPKVRTANRYTEMEVPFGYAGIPLYQLACLFFPFVITEMQLSLQSLGAYSLYLTNGKGLPILEGTIDKISSNNFEKIIRLYAKSPENRIQEFKIETAEKGNALEAYEKELGRKYTITDFLYYCVSRVIKDKFVVMVRYPLEDFRNVGPVRPIIITTERTEERKIFNNEYKRYPDLTTQPVKWVDSSQPNTTYLEGYGGDFDGDTVSDKGVFTQEANIELAENTMKPLNLLSPSAGGSRTVIKEAIISFYALTK